MTVNNEDLTMHDILQSALARDLEKKTEELNTSIPDTYGIPASPSSENTDVISKRMLEYGENIAKAFDDLAEATRVDADDFISQCKQNAELARQIARDRAAEAVKYTGRMRRLSTILKED